MLTQEQHDKLKLTEYKVDLASGQRPKDGFFGVDKAGTPDLVWDLSQYPWPFEDDSIEALNCDHYIEHIPMVEINGKDALFAFFDECYRILKPGGTLTITCPNARCNRAFQDPTHRRFIVGETFMYVAEWWRRENKLDHYNAECNLLGNVNPIVANEMNLLHPEVANKKFHTEWNSIMDWQAVLTKHPKGYTPEEILKQIAWQKTMREMEEAKKEKK